LMYSNAARIAIMNALIKKLMAIFFLSDIYLKGRGSGIG
jgi:hypothetical protein